MDDPVEKEDRPSVQIFSKIYDESIRTTDVISDVASFSDLMISPKICELLHRYQYFVPTPVQAKAIPLLLFGTDMIVQAKAGTGKTLVFAVLAAKLLHETEKTRTPQVLIVAPTREIAKQIYDTVRLFLPHTFWAGLFVGGVEVSADVELLRKGCQIAVGTCGRIAQLAKIKALHLKDVQLFVLDEADKLMEQDFVKEVNYIFSLMPQEMKQVCVFSATYPKKLEAVLKQYMHSPALLRLNVEGEQLIGVKEYCVFCESLNKAETLMILLNKLIFNQCIIFCDTLEFCANVYNHLLENNIDCTSLGSNLPQDQRFEILKQLKNKKIRILVTTDLMARGVDIFGVDLVINLTPAYDMETHMHRVGRAGRYGGKGLAITVLGNAPEAGKLCNLMLVKSLDIRTLDVSRDFPFNLIDDLDFHAKSVLFVNHPIIRGGEIEDVVDDMAALNVVQPEEETASVQPPESVPQRARTRKLFYLRHDFYKILADRSIAEWDEYAKESLNFMDYDRVTGAQYSHPELHRFAAEHQLKLKVAGSATKSGIEEAKSVIVREEVVDLSGDKILGPFSAFRSVAQFRSIHDALSGEPLEGAAASTAVVPERMSDEECRAAAALMIDLRRRVLNETS